MLPKLPYLPYSIAEWFGRKWHTPAIDGRIESNIGKRSGEVFPGRCYQGETGAYIDVSSFVTGTLTVKCWWKKESGVVHADSLDYNAIDAIVRSVYPIDATTPPIELTTEVDDVNKHIVLTDSDLYYALHVYDSGVLAAIYLGEEGVGFVAYDSLGNLNQGALVNVTLAVWHSTDAAIPYSSLNSLGYNIGEIPVLLDDINVDALGASANNIGQIRYPLQLVNSWCLLADGVWELQVDYEPIAITVNNIDEFANCTITNNGNGTWNVLFPTSLQVFNLLINGAFHYPVADGDAATTVESSNTISIATIVNGTYAPTSIWQRQDEYHWNAYQSFATTKALASTVESELQFPECPAVRSTGIDPSVSYSVAEIQNKISSSLFAMNANDYLGRLVLSSGLRLDEFCLDLTDGDTISFNSSNTWNSVSFSGTAQITIDLVAREITCTVSGTIFNIKVFNTSGELIEWYPCCEGVGTTIHDVISYFDATVSGNSWSSQTQLIYSSTYGYAFDKSLNVDASNVYVAMVTADSLTNRLARFRYSDNGILYRLYMECDGTGAGDTVNDPNGDAQGFVTINSNDVLNIYMGNSQSDVEMGSSTFFSIDSGFGSGRIYLLVDVLAGDPFHEIEIQDNSLSDSFIAAYQAYYSTSDSPYDSITTIEELFNSLNGGVATSGTNFPNGADDNYPSVTLGMTGVTSTELRAILDGVFSIANCTQFLQALYDDSVHQSTSNARSALIRRFFGTLNKVLLSGTLYELEMNVDNLLATQAGGGGGSEFFSNYERTLQHFDTIIFRTAGNSENNVDQWVHIHQLTVDSTAKIPAKYMSALELATEDVKGNSIQNTNALNSTGHHCRSMLNYTKQKSL